MVAGQEQREEQEEAGGLMGQKVGEGMRGQGVILGHGQGCG